MTNMKTIKRNVAIGTAVVITALKTTGCVSVGEFNAYKARTDSLVAKVQSIDERTTSLEGRVGSVEGQLQTLTSNFERLANLQAEMSRKGVDVSTIKDIQSRVNYLELAVAGIDAGRTTPAMKLAAINAFLDTLDASAQRAYAQAKKNGQTTPFADSVMTGDLVKLAFLAGLTAPDSTGYVAFRAGGSSKASKTPNKQIAPLFSIFKGVCEEMSAKYNVDIKAFFYNPENRVRMKVGPRVLRQIVTSYVKRESQPTKPAPVTEKAQAPALLSPPGENEPITGERQ